MIKNIIKRDGRIEPYIPSKLNSWGKWAASSVGNKVDWSSVVIQTVSSLPETVTSSELQEKLIQVCLDRESYSYYLMAGRLYAAHLHKTIHGGKIPSIKALHEKMIKDGIMVRMNYDDIEYMELEDVINHELDFDTPHFALHHIRSKYSLQNRAEGIEYETQQFVYMRMAMALAEAEPRNTRLELVKSFYHQFSTKRLSAPTPNYVNLGTVLKGYASCCLIAVGDNIHSLAAGDHIAYMMTASSAGIGTNIMSRSKGDPVRKGLIRHMGKLPYIASLGKAVRANTQNGRGGAVTLYYSGFDPEAEVIAHLRNPRSTEDRRNRDLHYALITNKFFASKVAKNEEAFTFNDYTAPELHKAFYSSDLTKFAETYKQYEENPNFKKEYFNPRDLILTSLNEALETGVAYLAFIDEINRHTPFKQPIHSSNLCVAPETLLLTDKGEFPIHQLVDQHVRVWNGEQWSDTVVRKTGENQSLLEVTLDKTVIHCTPYHKWYVVRGGQEVEVRTHELVPGDTIASWITPEGNITRAIVERITDNKRTDDTYCVSEPIHHKAVFNGILTGQCLEIAEPTAPYYSMQDLYSDKSVGYVKLQLDNRLIIQLEYTAKVVLTDGTVKFAGILEVGDSFEITTGAPSSSDNEYETVTVEKILEVKEEPEVALCSLAAIAIDKIDDTQGQEYFEEQYQEVMYHALKMIDYCILNSEYVLPHVGYTAKQRMNAAVGIMGLATYMAKRKLSYTSKEGLEEIHRVFERHMYHAIKASLRISKERGLAPWIHLTKWVDGWTPLDTYNKNVDELGDFKLQYDWKALSEEIKANGGIAHSVLTAIMPGEASSKAIASANAVYPIRNATLVKTDNNVTVRWAAPYSDDPEYQYDIAWDIPEVDMIKAYAVMQKWTDQAISADLWRRIGVDQKVSSKDLLNQYFTMVKYGIKTRYYYNSNTASGVSLTETGNINDNSNCVGGACTL